MTNVILPGPPGPDPSVEPPRPAKPKLAPFLRSRVMGPNGVAAALYIVLSVWIWRHPQRAAKIWRRLQSSDE